MTLTSPDLTETEPQARAGLSRFSAMRDLTEALAAPLGPEDQVVQSQPDSSPTKWHRAHTTWFFETFLLTPHLPGYRVVDESYGFLFNSYYEAIGPRQPRAARGLITRPSVDEVGDYRARVDDSVRELLAGLGSVPHTSAQRILEVLELGHNHEQQHQELLLMDALHLLSCSPLRPAYDSTAPAGHPPARVSDSTWNTHGGGIVSLGQDADRPGFRYDNEGPRHDVLLRPFALGEQLVTCGEWAAFIADDGYRHPDLWLSDGWALVQEQGWEAPLYWERDSDESWQVFSLRGLHPLDPAAPVGHVSYFEADAYARWSGYRLPTEAEWETVALGPDAPADMFGHRWQWTASPYIGYPGFKADAGAIGEYNGKFMVNQQVLRGSAFATPEGHARPTYRNFYPPGARWMFGGLRLARDL